MKTATNVGHKSQIILDEGKGLTPTVWAFGTVEGYAAEVYLEQARNWHQNVRDYTEGKSVAATIKAHVDDAKKRHHDLVWLSRECTVLLGAGYERQKEQMRLQRETIPTMKFGDVVRLGGKKYCLAGYKGNRDHVLLTPVK